MSDLAALSNYLKEYLKNPEFGKSIQEVVGHGVRALPVLGEFLHRDLPIEHTERLEGLVKAVLRAILTSRVSGRDARDIARFQQQLGFVMKYKSYTIKASTPVGYSIFLQNEREGFSFQRHIVHKLEVFHILRVKPGGYVFLCDYEEWKSAYKTDAFEHWLAGEPNATYDRYRFVPHAGDVFVISELGVVHTVIGCVLEEYATVSTDMVDRLHDQNAGKGIPSAFTRANAEAALRTIKAPAGNRLVRGFADRKVEPIAPVAVPGGERITLCDSFVRAARYVIRPGEEAALDRDEHRATLLRFFSGPGSVVMGDGTEQGRSIPRIAFESADLIFIPPGIEYAVRNEGDGYVEYSEHRIAPDVAFI
jgi:mannose-6-phosphate isomerase-like protein (cupin superfamily)